ncbi:hypothetical protein MAE02_57370 [Microvirga aerophila]|uniref:Uncharacterized protein n=1 Tax=Microvirga aerophila TaxID=670291 RepID=A0A512C1F3_9HYPH|nr:hypothetical protein MAE02_57370 [Microvirga aerophila]
MRSEPIEIAFLNGCDRRKMKTTVYIQHGPRHNARVRHVADDDFGRCRHILQLPSGKIVKDTNAMPLREQGLGEV